MCCDLCEYYFRCEDVEQQSALCCGRCNELEECNGESVSAHGMLDDEDYDDLIDEEGDEALDDDAEDEDEEDELDDDVVVEGGLDDEEDYEDEDSYEEDYLEEEYDPQSMH